MCCLGTTAQDHFRFTVGPSAENRLQEIEIRTGWQRVEEALPDRSDPVTPASRLQDRVCTSHRSWEVDQRAMNFRAGTQDLRQQRSRPAADIDHGCYLIPAPCDEDFRVWSAMTWRPHQRVKARRDVRMSFQILPERQAEQLVVGRSACSDGGGEAGPCRGHAATDAIEVKAELLRWDEQLSGCFIERELTGRSLLQNAFPHQTPPHPLPSLVLPTT